LLGEIINKYFILGIVSGIILSVLFYQIIFTLARYKFDLYLVFHPECITGEGCGYALVLPDIWVREACFRWSETGYKVSPEQITVKCIDVDKDGFINDNLAEICSKYFLVSTEKDCIRYCEIWITRLP
jgi:hypothetical protein